MELGEVIDISLPLNEKTVVWTEDPQPELRPILRTPKDHCNFTWLDFGAHAGTHVDAPYYLHADKWTADQIPLERLMGTCQVIDATSAGDEIGEEFLAGAGVTGRRILLKTINSLDDMTTYNPLHAVLTPGGANWLVEAGVTTLGFDYQSFERGGANIIHEIFLSRSITLIDNLRLGHVDPGEYTLMCLPVLITGIDAAPCRAVLLK